MDNYKEEEKKFLEPSETHWSQMLDHEYEDVDIDQLVEARERQMEAWLWGI